MWGPRWRNFRIGGDHWEHEGDHVGLRSSLSLEPDYVVLVLDNLVLVLNVEVLIIYKGRHTWRLGIGSIKLVVLTLYFHQISMNTQLRLLNIKKIYQDGWGETTRTLVPWKHDCNHPTKNQCMGWFALPVPRLSEVNLVCKFTKARVR